MKEKYVKPTIFIERFSLTQNIASGCAGSTLGQPYNNATDISNCAWDMGGIILFTTDVCASVDGGIKLGNGDSFASVCYNAPNSSLAPFSAL